MKSILENKWVKRCVGVVSSIYFAVITLLTYASFLYKLEFNNETKNSFITMYVIAAVVFLILMIYSRETLITRLISVLMMPVVFFMILFNMYNWLLIIPPFVVALVIFFAAGTAENVKVIMGTIYLLMYVLGIVAYFVLNALLGGSSVETTIDLELDPTGSVYPLYQSQMRSIAEVTDEANTISPDGEYKFSIVDVKDNDKGSIKIYVEPANQDIELKFFTLKQQGVRKTVTKLGTREIVPSVGWVIEEDSNGESVLALLYQLTPDDEPKTMKITQSSMPKKNYLGFLGIS
ncbi:MAG: hypothetical protein IJ746_02295 [Ruminococcus sp.]|nr:hypothetical protein [Ruminococcus sp.]